MKKIVILTGAGMSAESGISTFRHGEKIPKIEVTKPQLWWPNGLGEQPLYTVKTELLRDGEIIDQTQ